MCRWSGPGHKRGRAQEAEDWAAEEVIQQVDGVTDIWMKAIVVDIGSVVAGGSIRYT